MLLQRKEAYDLTLPSSKCSDVQGKYLALKILLIRVSGLVIILQVCLGKRARLKAFRSLKPIPPSIFRFTKFIPRFPRHKYVLIFTPPEVSNFLNNRRYKRMSEHRDRHSMYWNRLRYYVYQDFFAYLGKENFPFNLSLLCNSIFQLL